MPTRISRGSCPTIASATNARPAKTKRFSNFAPASDENSCVKTSIGVPPAQQNMYSRKGLHKGSALVAATLVRVISGGTGFYIPIIKLHTWDGLYIKAEAAMPLAPKRGIGDAAYDPKKKLPPLYSGNGLGIPDSR